MKDSFTKNINFSCYSASEDKELWFQLEHHLSKLKLEGVNLSWNHHTIGTEIKWDEEANCDPELLHLILWLISSDFLHRGRQFFEGMQEALKKCETKKTRAVSIYLRPIPHKAASFKGSTILPSNHEPVTAWSDRNLAFVDILKGLQTITREMLAEQWKEEENTVQRCIHEEVLETYKKDDFSVLSNSKGDVLYNLEEDFQDVKSETSQSLQEKHRTYQHSLPSFSETHVSFNVLILKQLKRCFVQLAEQKGPNKSFLFNRAIREYLENQRVNLDQEPPPLKGQSIPPRRRSSTPIRTRYDSFTSFLVPTLKAHFERYCANKGIIKTAAINQAIHDFCLRHGVLEEQLPPRHE